jgi:hypothetical protein
VGVIRGIIRGRGVAGGWRWLICYIHSLGRLDKRAQDQTDDGSRQISGRAIREVSACVWSVDGG